MLRQVTLIIVLVVALVLPGVMPVSAQRTLYWGLSGVDVGTVQWRLATWGYYNGPVDHYYGNATAAAVRLFQARNGLPVDGVVGPATWAALGFAAPAAATRAAAPVATQAAYTHGSSAYNLLTRTIAAEARGEPFAGMVAVGAVILNRVNDSRFPNTVAGVVMQPHAFESVSNGLIWSRTPDATEARAASNALAGWDPTYGCLFFWNPSKPVSAWIWSRPIVVRIGNHVFAR